MIIALLFLVTPVDALSGIQHSGNWDIACGDLTGEGKRA